MNNIFLRGFLLMLHRWQRSKTIAELSAMPDHLLDDIGIERHQIVSVVDGIMEQRDAKQKVAQSKPVRKTMATTHATPVKA